MIAENANGKLVFMRRDRNFYELLDVRDVARITQHDGICKVVIQQSTIKQTVRVVCNDIQLLIEKIHSQARSKGERVIVGRIPLFYRDISGQMHEIDNPYKVEDVPDPMFDEL